MRQPAAWMRFAIVLMLSMEAACGESGGTRTADGSAASQSSTVHHDPELVQLRGVVQEVPTPCPPASQDQLTQVEPDEPGRCVVLGPVEVDASHITSSRLGLPDGTDLVVLVDLDAAGSRALNELAARQFDAGGKAAIVVQGQVTSVISFQQREYHGQFVISGLGLDRAQQLVRALGGDATPPTTSPPSEAERICDEHRPPEVGDLAVTFVVGSLAQLVAARIRAQGGDPAPWDQLPNDHVVVQCGYGTAATESSAAPALNLGCYQYYVDSEGRSTEISAASSPCAAANS